MGFLRVMTTRVFMTVYHSPSHLCVDNSWYIALYTVICFCWNWIHFNQLNWVILHLISDVLIYLRCHIFRCSTSFRSITYLYEVFKVHIERVSFFVEVCPMRFNLNESQWAWVDSNHRPHAYQACALTTWATSPFGLWSFPRPAYSIRMISHPSGEYEIRTRDLLLARQALSQLS